MAFLVKVLTGHANVDSIIRLSSAKSVLFFH